jgi:hypothetical protein
MTIIRIGPACERPGCNRPVMEFGLCGPCLRLCRAMGRDPELFASEPLRGAAGHDQPTAPDWDELEREAARRGLSLAELIGFSGR